MNPNYQSYLMPGPPMRGRLQPGLTAGQFGSPPPSYFNDPTAAAGYLGANPNTGMNPTYANIPPWMQIPPWLRKRRYMYGGGNIIAQPSNAGPSYFSW